jgi:hypothetical protein
VPRALDALDRGERRDAHLDGPAGRAVGQHVQQEPDGGALYLAERLAPGVDRREYRHHAGPAHGRDGYLAGPGWLPEDGPLLVDGGEHPGGINLSGGHA